MSYNLSDRLSYVGERMEEINSETVTYSRGVWSKTLPASPLATNGRTLDKFNIIHDHVIDQIWSMNVRDIVLGQEKTLPQVGDRIVRSLGEIYQVVTAGNAPYRYSTSNRERLIVATVRIHVTG